LEYLSGLQKTNILKNSSLKEALACYLKTQMDMLVMGDIVVSRV
jgi:predicted NodU family carbamoyl transferase